MADGAHDNWNFLTKHTDKQTLDFYYATEYLSDVAESLFVSPIERKKWLNDRCHELKHTPGAAQLILAEMKKFEDMILNNQPILWVSSNTCGEVRGIIQKENTSKDKKRGPVEPLEKKSGKTTKITCSSHYLFYK